MAQRKNSTNLTELLLKCMAEPNPMLSMLEWLCAQLMEAEVSGIVGVEKNAHNSSRSDYRCGYRPRRLDTRYPVIWTDVLYEKVCMDGRVLSMAVMVVCGVNEQGHRNVLAVEPMLDESKESYCQLFQSLLERGLKTPLFGSFRCRQRTDCRHPGKLSRRILAALQSAFHA